MLSAKKRSVSVSSAAKGNLSAKKDTLNKLRKGKRDGTPDKMMTPTTLQEAQDGGPQADDIAIINDEIRSLQIKPEDLQRVREPQPPVLVSPSYNKACVFVRKMKPASEWNRIAPREVSVARPAPPDAPLKVPDYTGNAGPRFNTNGSIIEHSILGSVEQYKEVAKRRGELPGALTEITEKDRQPHMLTPKYEKQTVNTQPHFQSVEQSNALKNWEFKMRERKRQQGHLSKVLNKPVEDLVMNQSDSYRQVQELRYLMDRAIPVMGHGHGYRVGSEFWNQQLPIGNDVTGINMTLTQTEQGYPPPIQHVGVPWTVLREKGIQLTQSSQPWHKSAYLKKRLGQLKPVMSELDPHVPDMMNLELVGVPVIDNCPKPQRSHPMGAVLKSVSKNASNELLKTSGSFDPLKDHPDTRPSPVFGPSILFSGTAARWTGNAQNLKDELGCEARVIMEAYAGQRTTSYLEVINDGTTAIYYDWMKVAKVNPFGVPKERVQRFYFNNSSNIILPGDNVKFPFVFKSPNPGIFSEQWHFQTHPVVCGGAALVVTLRGTALAEDKYCQERADIESELALRQAKQVVREVLDELLNGVRTPPRPSSPVDAYITEEEVFLRRNPSLYYHNETINDLRALYIELFPEEERETVQWDLTVNSIKKKLMECELEEDQRDELLIRLNKGRGMLIFPQFGPKQKQMYIAGYKLMCDAVEKMVEHSIQLKIVLGLPGKDEESPADEPSENRRATGSRAGQKPDKKKDKDAKGGTKTPGKDVRETPKPLSKGTPGSGSQTKQVPTAVQSSVTMLPPAEVSNASSVSSIDALVINKYKEKFSAQAYLIVSEMIDQISAVFADIECMEGVKPVTFFPSES